MKFFTSLLVGIALASSAMALPAEVSEASSPLASALKKDPKKPKDKIIFGQCAEYNSERGTQTPPPMSKDVAKAIAGIKAWDKPIRLGNFASRRQAPFYKANIGTAKVCLSVTEEFMAPRPGGLSFLADRDTIAKAASKIRNRCRISSGAIKGGRSTIEGMDAAGGVAHAYYVEVLPTMVLCKLEKAVKDGQGVSAINMDIDFDAIENVEDIEDATPNDWE
ncbi:hypothetical protein BX600DRAFT_493163 [Xylariales sp. PMI_506]|nr:hypothetical protein BX600DRAFT_493163 [Xylariales sp. PMI_506]